MRATVRLVFRNGPSRSFDDRRISECPPSLLGLGAALDFLQDGRALESSRVRLTRAFAGAQTTPVDSLEKDPRRALHKTSIHLYSARI